MLNRIEATLNRLKEKTYPRKPIEVLTYTDPIDDINQSRQSATEFLGTEVLKLALTYIPLTFAYFSRKQIDDSTQSTLLTYGIRVSPGKKIYNRTGYISALEIEARDLVAITTKIMVITPPKAKAELPSVIASLVSGLHNAAVGLQGKHK